MSRFFLAFLICAALVFDLTHAQETTPAAPQPPASPVSDVKPPEPTVQTSIAKPAVPRKPRVAPKPVATPLPVATPVPRKPGFWQRLFGRRATPRPVPRPKPTPVVKAPPVVKPAPKPKTHTIPGKTRDAEARARKNHAAGRATGGQNDARAESHA